jgi:glycosyltransferase involved in cell wall biosynthesis
MELVSTPSFDWHPIDKRVKLLFVPSLEERHIPNGDILFATAWQTARPVLKCSSVKGEKYYFIQHYETWMGPKDLVDETWRMPLRKVVISRWLAEIGGQITDDSLTQIPNGIDHQRYKIIQPIESRRRQVAMMFSPVEFKRSKDGLAALEIAKKEFPDLRVVLFGSSRHLSWIPKWMSYVQNPPQDWIVGELYNRSSIILNSSLTEGFALPPAEGAACGCAIVATDSGGIRDFVQHDVTGLLSPPRNPDALAHNLCLLLRNDDLRIRLARSGNDFIKRFTWDRSADLLEEFITRGSVPNPLEREFVTATTAEVSPA